MKLFHLDRATFVAFIALGALAVSGCAQVEDPNPSGQAEDSASTSQSLVAGKEARTRFGVANYEVRLNPDKDGNHVIVDLVSESGTTIGSLVTYRDAMGGTTFRISKDGSITELFMDSSTMMVMRDGIVRYTLDRAAINASGSLAELEASAEPMPEDVVPAVGLAATVTSDQVLIDYVKSISPNDVPYLVKDCPWWVTAAACLGWETGVGAVMCVACGASYLL